MATLLVPLNLDACSISDAGEAVPSLADAPFADDDENASLGATLEPGVHLHWALPDALTRAQKIELESGEREAVFPAVPDLWLIVRLAPVTDDEGGPGRVAIDSRRSGLSQKARFLGGRSSPSKLRFRRPTATRMRSTATKQVRVPSASMRQRLRGTSSREASEVIRDRAPSSRKVSDVLQEREAAKSGGAIRDKDAVAIGPDRPELGLSSRRRGFKAWVLDSRTGQSTELSAWKPEELASGAGEVLTAMGVLDEHGERPGWGRWDSAKGEGDVLASAYYPHVRDRFGFCDPLDDLDGDEGSLSYAVIGWYRDRSQDPLYRAEDREDLLRAWKLRWKDPERREIVWMTLHQQAIARKVEVPRTIEFDDSLVGESQERRQRQGSLLTRSAASSEAARAKISETLRESIGAGLQPLLAPTQLCCHGAVIELRRGPSGEAVGKTWTVKCSSSLRRAIAETVTPGTGWDPAMVEALLNDVDAQAGTMAGVSGMPAKLHELSFISTPGDSRYYGQLRIRAESPKRARAGKLAVVDRRTQLGLQRSTFGKLTDALDRERDEGLTRRPTRRDKPEPYEPSASEISSYRTQLEQALSAIGRGDVHDRRVRVVDERRGAQPGRLAPLRTGSEGAAWWLDIHDEDQLRALLIAIHDAERVDLPSAEDLYEEPGPRWYRPGAPQVMIEHVDRGYRHGYDGRFESDGTLRCRLAGMTVSGTGVEGALQGQLVPGADLLAGAAQLELPGLPAASSAVIEELLLVDPSCAGLLADAWIRRHGAGLDRGVLVDHFRAQALAWLKLRDTSLDGTQKKALEDGLRYRGRLPSPVSVTPWGEAWNPLFAWVEGEHRPTDLQQDYVLGEYELDRIVDVEGASAGLVHRARAPLNSVVTRVLEGTLIDRLTAGPNLELIPHGPPVGEPGAFERYDLLSVSLGDYDQWLYDLGQRVRCGDLGLSQIAVFDSFGRRRSWTYDANHAEAEQAIGVLPPRLPHWARLMARFVSVTDDEVEADPTLGHSPVSGYLVPDYVEQALEVFDADGQAIGQLVGDPPVNKPTSPGSLGVRFEPHPWRTLPDPQDPFSGITDEHLGDFVRGVAAQLESYEAGTEGYVESGLTALMRVIDTVAGTVDKADKLGEQRVRMLGKVIAVVRARLWFETSASETSPSPQADPVGDHPPIRVQLGAVSQPDDGVYGVFLANKQDPSASRFAPVSREVVEDAVLNGLRDATGSLGVSSAKHAFVAEVPEAEIELAPNEPPRALTVLLDLGGALHLSTGVLPRKRLTLPQEFTAAAQRAIEPTFHVGPVLALPEQRGLRPLLPVPDLPGMRERWVEEPTLAERGDPEAWDESTPPTLPGPGALPSARAVFTRGWLRFEPEGLEGEDSG